MNVYQIKKMLNDNGVILSFSGTISQSIVVSVAETLEAELTESKVDSKIIQKAFSIITEQMQNIMSYSKDNIQRDGNIFKSIGLTLVGFDNIKAKYYIASSNNMYIQDQERLETKLKKIQSLDAEELKKYYKESRKSSKNKHDRGAGLGFIIMAKNSSEVLEYTLYELDKVQAHFEIKVYL